VMIGSIGGRIAGPILGAYQAAKHGLVGLTGALRAELVPAGIKVLLLEPGAIATPIWQRGLAAGDEIEAGRQEEFARYGPQLAVAARVLVQVLLVVVLGVVELRRRPDLGGDRAVARPAELGLELVPDPGRRGRLLRGRGVDRRPVLGADVVALAHALGRVVVL